MRRLAPPPPRPTPPPPAEVQGLTAPGHGLERRKDAESRVLAETHLQEAGRRRHWRRGGREGGGEEQGRGGRAHLPRCSGPCRRPSPAALASPLSVPQRRSLCGTAEGQRSRAGGGVLLRLCEHPLYVVNDYLPRSWIAHPRDTAFQMLGQLSLKRCF